MARIPEVIIIRFCQSRVELLTPRDPSAFARNTTPILRTLSKMSFSASSPSYTFFPATPSAPNAFSLFGSIQSPRDTYNMCEDARQAFYPSNERTAQWKASKSGLKKLFGL